MRTTVLFRRVCAACCALAVSAFGQLNLPPGGTVTPPNASPLSTVQASQTIPFSILNVAGALLYRGTIQNDVIKNSATNRLAFSIRTINPTAGLNGIIDRIEYLSYTGNATAVSWRTGLGTTAPSLASRSAGPGANVTWDFNPGITSSVESKFCEILTDATAFNNRGFLTIVLTTGDSATVRVYQPAVATPVAVITSPSPFSCVCNPATITGTADAPGGFGSYTLEFSQNPAGPWTTIATSTSPVVAGTLGVWNTGALVGGYYFLRLRVSNTAGEEASFVTVVLVDSGFDNLTVRSPVTGGIYGGVVCLDGTVTDSCFDRYSIDYRRVGVVAYTSILTSATQVINDPLGSWNAGGLADGNYEVRVSARDACGHTATVSRFVEIDNTAPIALITRPTNCDSVLGLVRVFGTAFDRNLSRWDLSITGGPFNDFVSVASGSTNIVDDLIAALDTRSLPHCCYTLRLRVTDLAAVNCDGPHQTDYYVSLDIGDIYCGADFNMDGGVDGQDVQAFFQVWENGGCLP